MQSDLRHCYSHTRKNLVCKGYQQAPNVATSFDPDQTRQNAGA